jgi:hypothetical protein
MMSDRVPALDPISAQVADHERRLAAVESRLEEALEARELRLEPNQDAKPGQRKRALISDAILAARPVGAEIPCGSCGRFFAKKRVWARFCSQDCRMQFHGRLVAPGGKL